jgi:hypothetical protein
MTGVRIGRTTGHRIECPINHSGPDVTRRHVTGAE